MPNPSRAGEPTKTTVELLQAAAAANPEQTAFIVPDAGSLTFAEWDEQSSSFAGALHDRGVEAGAPIGLLFDNLRWVDYAIAYFGVQKAGGVSVPLASSIPPEEFARIQRDCALTAVVHADVLPPPEGIPSWFFSSVEASATAPGLDVDLTPDDPAEILYTSGSTGVPKGVVSAHGLFGFRFGSELARAPESDPYPRLHALPFGTNASQYFLFSPFDRHQAGDRGCSLSPLVVMPSFSPEPLCRLVRDFEVRMTVLVPAMIFDLLSHLPRGRDELESLEILESAAAPLPPATFMELARQLPWVTLKDCYSSTEAWPASTVMLVDGRRAGSVGRPYGSTVVRIVGPDGSELPPNEHGDVLMRAAGLSHPRRYLHPDDDGTVFRDGWVATGDIGYLDEDGYLFIVDRAAHIINSGGFKVSSLAIESTLTEHPSVDRAAVVGLEHTVLGQYTVAAVVLNSPASEPELRSFVAERLGARAAPRRIVPVDALPLTRAGKTDKELLRRRLRAADPPIEREMSGTEQRVAEIWAEVLGVPEVGLFDDFYELGGESLAAMRLFARVQETFGIEFPFSTLLDAHNVSEVAVAIEAVRESSPAR